VSFLHRQDPVSAERHIDLPELVVQERVESGFGQFHGALGQDRFRLRQPMRDRPAVRVALYPAGAGEARCVFPAAVTPLHVNQGGITGLEADLAGRIQAQPVTFHDEPTHLEPGFPHGGGQLHCSRGSGPARTADPHVFEPGILDGERHRHAEPQRLRRGFRCR